MIGAVATAFFTAPEYESAREVAREALGEEINQTREKLFALQRAYEALGGTYEDEDDAKAKQQQAAAGAPVHDGERPGNRAATPQLPATPLEFNVDSHDAFDEKEAQVHTLLMLARQNGAGQTVRIDDIAGFYGGSKSRWYSAVSAFRAKLRRLHGEDLVNVRGLGYRLVKL